MLTDILNLYLPHAVVSTCFKSTFIVPIPKNSNPSSLNNYCPVALTPIITKCFEQLVRAQLKSCLTSTLDSHQFAYCQNRSTEDAVSINFTLSSHTWTIKTPTPKCCLETSVQHSHPLKITKLTDLGIIFFLCAAGYWTS